MIDSIFILSGLGEVLIEKHYRHGTPRSAIADLFWERTTLRRGGEQQAEDEEYLDTEDELPPIVVVGEEHAGRFAMHIKRGDLTYVAGVTREASPMMVVELLNRVHMVLLEYLGPPDEVKIKDAFTTVYQILDEILDGGFPLVTEPNALKSMIAPPTVANKMRQVVMAASGNGYALSSTLPTGAEATSTSPWRNKNVSYIQNEIFVDLEERLDCVVDGTREQAQSGDVRGSIMVTSRLSGMPEVLLHFEDSRILGDVSFHPCVRIDRWEREKVVSFLPPDGTFELMTYRMAKNIVSPTMIQNSVPFYCRPQVTTSSTSPTNSTTLQGRIEILVGPKKSFAMIQAGASAGGLAAEDVSVRLPLPPHAKFLEAKPSEGRASFVDRTCVWNIGKVDSNNSAARLTGSFVLPASNHSQPSQVSVSSTTSLDFTLVAERTVSGLRVSSLEITNQSYKYFKGVKSLLRSGEFQIRT